MVTQHVVRKNCPEPYLRGRTAGSSWERRLRSPIWSQLGKLLRGSGDSHPLPCTEAVKKTKLANGHIFRRQKAAITRCREILFISEEDTKTKLASQSAFD